MLMIFKEFGALDFTTVNGLLVSPVAEEKKVTIILHIIIYWGSRQISPVGITYLAS